MTSSGKGVQFFVKSQDTKLLKPISQRSHLKNSRVTSKYKSGAYLSLKLSNSLSKILNMLNINYKVGVQRKLKMMEDEISIIGVSSISTQKSFALPAMISLASNQFSVLPSITENHFHGKTLFGHHTK